MSQALPPEVKKTINEVASCINTGNTIIFCGAGISSNSGFPVVSELVPSVLLMLCSSNEEINTKEVKLKNNKNVTQSQHRLKQIIAEKMDVPLEVIDKIINTLPFEAFVETLRDHSEIERIMEIYDARTYVPNIIPNINHDLIARLVIDGKVRTILTTNFDQLIEEALARQHMQAGRDYEVIYREEDLVQIDWGQDRCRLIKIHGSVDDKHDMDITLSQIAKREMSAARACIIRHVFSQGNQNQVLILGYSCSDVFDLSPQIQTLTKDLKQVVLIQHSEVSKIEDLRKQEYKNPFKAFNNGTRLFINTDQLIKLLWEATLKEPYPDADTELRAFKTYTDWKAKVRAWYIDSVRARSESIKDAILGKLFDDICEWQVAIGRYNRVLAYARRHASEPLEAMALGNMGISYNSLCEYCKAIKHFKMAGEIGHRLGDAQGESNALSNVGLAYISLGKYRKAIRFFKQSSEIARRIRHERNESDAVGNMGLAYINMGEYKEGIKLTIKQFEIADRIGDVQGKRNALGNRGLAYIGLHEYRRAIELCEQALEIDRNIGDPQGEGRDLNMMGGAYLELRDYGTAIKLFEQYLDITRRIGDVKGESDALGNIGAAYLDQGKCRKAMGFFKQSAETARRIKHLRNEGNALCNMGMAYTSIGDKEKATLAFAKSKAIFTKLALPHMVNYVDEMMKRTGL